MIGPGPHVLPRITIRKNHVIPMFDAVFCVFNIFNDMLLYFMQISVFNTSRLQRNVNETDCDSTITYNDIVLKCCSRFNRILKLCLYIRNGWGFKAIRSRRLWQTRPRRSWQTAPGGFIIKPHDQFTICGILLPVAKKRGSASSLQRRHSDAWTTLKAQSLDGRVCIASIANFSADARA